jgi:fructokinase
MAEKYSMPIPPTIVGLGEVLWDVFPDAAHFGGAPANFACSIAELGGDSVNASIVSSLGRDELGRRALDLLDSHGVDTGCVSFVEQSTGKVLVQLDSSGQASYEFAADTAWDNIAWSNDLHELAIRADAVCFGTLGQRSHISRETIQRFLRATRPECLRILDINLRPPFWTEQILIQSLELANVLKLNDAEIGVVANLLEWKHASDSILEQLIDRFSLRLVALTRGADGAMIRNDSGQSSDLPGEPVAIADTVGAGDAYTAVLAIGMLNRLPLDAINAWGNRVASYICSQPGATPRIPAHLHQP